MKFLKGGQNLEFEEFKSGYNQFCQNWQRKGGEDQAQFLYEKIKFIPAAAWGDMVSEILATLERFPRVKDLFAMWYDWRNKHSHQLIEDAPEETDCVWCGALGILEYRTERENREYTGIAACGHCENWKKHISPKVWGRTATYKVTDLAIQGWEWIKPPEPCSKYEALDAIEIAMNKLGTGMRQYRGRDPDWRARQDDYEDEVPF
jgi:hypothetical protein